MKKIFILISTVLLLGALSGRDLHAADNSSFGCSDACTVTVISLYHIGISAVAGFGVCHVAGCYDSVYEKDQKLRFSIFTISSGAIVGFGVTLGYFLANKSEGFNETLFYVHAGSVVGGAALGYFIGRYFVAPGSKLAWNFSPRQTQNAFLGRAEVFDGMNIKLSVGF